MLYPCCCCLLAACSAAAAAAGAAPATFTCCVAAAAAYVSTNIAIEVHSSYMVATSLSSHLDQDDAPLLFRQGCLHALHNCLLYGPMKCSPVYPASTAIAAQRHGGTAVYQASCFELACSSLQRSWTHVEAALVVCHGAAVCCCCGSRSDDVGSHTAFVTGKEAVWM
jgi:hypothetical protein